MQKTRPNADGGHVTDLYVLQRDETSGQAIVSDGLILDFNNDQPMGAKLCEDTAKKVVLIRKVRMTNSTGQMANMQFRASYFKAKQIVLVRASPGGDYSNSFGGRGRCNSV